MMSVTVRFKPETHVSPLCVKLYTQHGDSMRYEDHGIRLDKRNGEITFIPYSSILLVTIE